MSFTAAAVQAAPAYLDKEATIEKACDRIREGGENGAEIVAFGESFVPGYPWFIWMGAPSWWLQFQGPFYENALTIPSDELDAIREAAAEADAHVMLGATVREGDSLYCAQVFVDRHGEYRGQHRKLKPTHLERAIWGEGPGDEMQVYDLDIGRVGGLNCWENMMPLSRYVNYELGEQLHVSSFPGYAMEHVGRLFKEEVNRTISRHLAVEGGVFVLNASNVIAERHRDFLCDTAEREDMLSLGGGWSEIVAPNGQVIGGPVEGETEEIVYAEIDLDNRIPVKSAFDAVGHYTRPDVAKVELDLRGDHPVTGREPPTTDTPYDVAELRDAIEGLSAQLEDLEGRIEHQADPVTPEVGGED